MGYFKTPVMYKRNHFQSFYRISAITAFVIFFTASCQNGSEKKGADQAGLSNYNIRTGIIYRNPKAHVLSRHAYFPSVTVMGNGEMLASFAIGEAFESVDSDTYVSRSVDNGETWTEPVRMLKPDDKRLVSNYARIVYIPGTGVVANIIRSLRDDHPEEGLANSDNLGFVPTELLISVSADHGKTWDEPILVKPPLAGPSFEMCSPVVSLSDGRWIWPTSTWRGWDGYEPDGMKMVALISNDKGRTWPEYRDVMDRHDEKIIFWESKIVELSDNKLLAIAWAYDEKNWKRPSKPIRH
jgi:sialidase-1